MHHKISYWTDQYPNFLSRHMQWGLLMPLELGQTLISITRICIRLKTLLTVHTVHLKNDGSKSESINCHHYRKGERQATLPSCLLPLLLFEFRQFKSNSTTQRRRHMVRRTATRRRSTAVKWRASVRDGMAHTLACREARQLRRSAATVAASCNDCGGGLLWTLRFWGISASLHNWTIVSCTFLWDPQSVKTTDYGCLIKFFLSNVLADCTQKLWIWSLISFKLWTS